MRRNASCRIFFCFPGKVKREAYSRLYRRRRGDPATGHITDDGQPGQEQPGPPFAAGKGDDQAAGNGSYEDGEESSAFNEGVSGNEFPLFQMLREQGIFGGTEEGRLSSHQEKQHQKCRNVTA